MQALNFLTTAACIGMLSAAAFAQSPTDSTPSRISGTVTAFDGTTLMVTPLQQGQALSVTLPPDIPIGAVADRTLADIKPGDFVGSAAVRGEDGKLHAQEVHIFPESRRGTGEGHRPMAGPQQTMTNATVAVIAADAGTRVLTLKSPDGTLVARSVQAEKDGVKPLVR